ncbi:SUR7/PalI family-domain-containing protein [Cyathus striatus]|nr:SUR7/PalI family-domain-containing protein [Cyathus striatus]
MGFIRPATPGFIVTLVAAILLAVVSFCVPYFKSVYFLKATISQQGLNGTITFGTLGYCTEFLGATNCSKPSIGYELDVNSLLGVASNKLDIEIPQVAVKWITYALFLHVVALALAVGSAVFGLLAHVREMSMACCSTCISGFAAAVALLAFIFDLVLFFVAKARINAIGSAQMGNAIWLTLAAWILLFFSGCFYTLGRCCISNRPDTNGRSWGNKKSKDAEYNGGRDGDYAEQMRLDAVKAEADRKARQKAIESDLPAFSETQPLTLGLKATMFTLRNLTRIALLQLRPRCSMVDRSWWGICWRWICSSSPGTRAVDEYYSPSQNNNTANPTSGFAPSPYGPTSYGAPVTTSPPLLNPPAPVQAYASDPFNSSSAQQYGHTGGALPSSYSPYDPYNNHTQYNEPTFNPTTYNNTALLSGAAAGAAATRYASTPAPNPYISSPPQPAQPDRSYTLGGEGYGANSVPPLQNTTLLNTTPTSRQAQSTPE